MDIESILAVGGLVVGGVGAVATAVSAYLIGRRRADTNDKKVDVDAQKVEVEDKKVDALERRIEIEHHDSIVGGYKDLILQYQAARDVARKEVHDLRDVVNALKLQVELLTKIHEKCEIENRELKLKQALQQAEIDTQRAEIQQLRSELAQLRATYDQGATSATPEPHSAA